MLTGIFPETAQQTWNVADLAGRTYEASRAIATRLNMNKTFPARSTADEMILYYAINVHTERLDDYGLPHPSAELTEVYLEDLDFIFLFDTDLPDFQNSAVAASMGMTITGSDGWFKQFDGRTDSALDSAS